MVDPAQGPPGTPTYLVNAPHGGLMTRTAVRLLIRGILAGGPTVRAPTHQSLLARMVHGAARPWESPSLPLTLDPAGTCRL